MNTIYKSGSGTAGKTLVWLLVPLTIVQSLSDYPLLLIVSFDGFRGNYLDMNATPFLKSLQKNGSFCGSVVSVFPTITFTNHYSLATGVYSQTHGVVMNRERPSKGLCSSTYDAEDEILDKQARHRFWHYNERVLPIWTVNELNRPGRHSGVMMWPGSEEKYHNLAPTFYEAHNKATPPEERFDKAITWFLHPKTPANLVMVYVNDPDATAHMYGPDSPQTFSRLKMLDAATIHLYNRLKAENLLDKVNVLLLSDHGMTTVKMSSIVDISERLLGQKYTKTGSSPVLHFVPDKGYELTMFDALKEAAVELKTFSVYRKKEIPERWRFRDNELVGELIAVANEGFVFDDFRKKIEYYEKCKKLKVTKDSTFGEHGYDNRLPSMQPSLLAFGPSFKKNHKMPTLQLVDMFPLFCSLLRINPAPPTNGSLTHITKFLVASTSAVNRPTFTIVASVLLATARSALPS